MSRSPEVRFSALRRPWAVAAAGLLTAVALAALLAPWLPLHDPEALVFGEELARPSWSHPLGQDLQGADVLSRLLIGARLSLGIGFSVVLLAATVGTLVGGLAGFYRGWLDGVLMRLVDVLLAFPGLLLAIALVAVLGPSPANVVLALAALGWVSFARLVRGQVLSLRERPFVLAARTSGQSDLRVLWLHVLPQVMPVVVVQATFGVASVILAESSLAFLGLGAPPGTPSWGAMLAEGKRVLLEAPHVSIAPGVAIFGVVLALNLLGDALRDQLDPRAREPRR